MTEPLKPISKAAQATFAGSDLELPNAPQTQTFEPILLSELAPHDTFTLDQTSPSIRADSFVSGEEVLAASLALFAPEPKQTEDVKISSAKKTLELYYLEHLSGSNSSRITAKSESGPSQFQRKSEEHSFLYAAYASSQAQLKKDSKRKKKNLWQKISGFLKSVFLMD